MIDDTQPPQKPGQKPGWGYGVYEPPRTASATPGVILWYRVYALMMALFYAATCVTSYVRQIHHHDAVAEGIAFGIGGVAVLYAAAAFIRLTPRGWTIGLVVIAFGLAFGFFPAAIALMIYWNKPLTKAAFARV